jgi:hypothetical protein
MDVKVRERLEMMEEKGKGEEKKKREGKGRDKRRDMKGRE